MLWYGVVNTWANHQANSLSAKKGWIQFSHHPRRDLLSEVNDESQWDKRDENKEEKNRANSNKSLKFLKSAN